MTDETPASADLRVLAQKMAGLLTGYQITAAVGALARLGVADALADGPLPVPELAARVGADADALGRVLRAADDAGLFAPADGGRIRLTPLGQLLRGDVPGSARRAALAATEEWRWRAYGHLPHTLRTGEPGFRPAHGCGFWPYLDRHPQEAAWFNDAMTRISAITAPALVQCYDFAGVSRLVDVGGGHGELLQAVLLAHPAMRGVLFDLPGVVAGAAERLSTTSVADRIETAAGDVFDGVPPGGDAYVLSWVLHDWDDASAARILGRCRVALPGAGRVLVIEMIVPAPGDEPTPGAATASRLVRETDLEMLVVVGGRERTLEEYRRLFAAADLRPTRVAPLGALPWTLMEATAA